MKEAVVLLMIKDDVDNDFIDDLLIGFPQVIEVKKIKGPFNTRIHLKSETLEELKNAYSEVIPRFEDYDIKDLLTVAEDW